MPNRNAENDRYATVGQTAVGPAAYNAAARPTITMPCKDIDNIRDVEMWNEGGFAVRPVSRARNVVTYMVLNIARAGAVGAVQDHAAHAHDLLVRQAAGAKGAISGEANVLGDLAGANTYTVAGGDAANGGVQNVAAMAHVAAAAATKLAAYEEVLNGTVLNAVNFHARTRGRIW